MAKKTEKIFRFLIYILPGVLFFSYYPLIHFTANESMNFEISLPLIWLVLFDILVLGMMWEREELWKGLKKKWPWLLLPVFLSLSVLWSANPLRGILTVGILWLIYVAGFGFWNLRDLFSEVSFREKFWKAFFGSSLVISAWCFLQCLLDLVGVSREISLMCAGCVTEMFGFPHPNGFAIEPQFMGNLLLAPALIAAWMWIGKRSGKNLELKHSRSRIFDNGSGGAAPKLRFRTRFVTSVNNTSGSCFLYSKFLPLCFFITSATLFLTFSRGAIYAFVIGMMVVTIWSVFAEKAKRKIVLKRTGLAWMVVVLAFLFTLNLQGVMAAASSTNDTYAGGVAKVINHLSLGVIDIKPSQVEKQEIENEAVNRDRVVENSVENSEEKTAAFDGYVAESTDARLRLSGAAFEIWHHDLKNVFVGVGLGGAGQSLYDFGLSPAPKEIVQNQYMSLLLETGLIGVVLAIITLAMVVRIMWRDPARIVLAGLLVAYGVSLLFFSGLPNALHIYLLLGLFLAIKKPEDRLHYKHK